MSQGSKEPSVTRSVVRAGSYHDSVVLMQLQRALAALPGVLDAGVVMATPANRQLLAAGGLDAGVEAGPDDLLIVVKAESEPAAGEALSRVDALLRVRSAEAGEGFRPRSLATALKQLPAARWVLVSVPGRYAADVADEALDHGRNVFLYSDNVSLEREAALKRKARDKGLLVLGPDCGTAVLGGVGLGFSNRTRPGQIGLIGASGTGLQAVISHLDQRGQGISQAIGTGGRDLSTGIGGITAAQALDLLRRDPETEVIVLISKPPAPEVTRRLLARARAADKPVIACFLGAPPPGQGFGEVWFANSLEEAADEAREALIFQRSSGLEAPPVRFAAGQRWVRGLFSGGTLALETLARLAAVLAPVFSNIPLTAEQRLSDPLRSQGHTILDLGADEFTVGRLHPMMDFDLRLRRMRQEAADPEVALLILDLVLGDGAHADPAGELAPVVEHLRAEAHAAGRALDVAVLLIGTEQDPQDRQLQTETLERAGATVLRTVGELVDHVLQRMDEIGGDPEPGFPPVPLEAIQDTRAVINVGIETFSASLAAQGAEVVQVDWRPPAGGNEKLAAILTRMKGRG